MLLVYENGVLLVNESGVLLVNGNVVLLVNGKLLVNGEFLFSQTGSDSISPVGEVCH